jgi:ADP-ribosylation factor-like protein 2
MGLLSIVRKLRAVEKEMRVLVIGLDCAGKSSCVNRLRGEDVNNVAPTQGFDIASLRHASGYTLNLWDVGGQRTIRAYWRNYFEATDAIVWVVDSADSARMPDCRLELETVLQEERLAGATLLVLANKQDLAGALPPERIADLLGLNDAVGRKRHWQVFPCSAIAHVSDRATEGKCSTNVVSEAYGPTGLEAGFDWLVADVASRIYLLD